MEGAIDLTYIVIWEGWNQFDKEFKFIIVKSLPDKSSVSKKSTRGY